MTAVQSSRAWPYVGLAALFLLLGNRGLETAEANGDTRTISLHHIHTDENITITYKRDGRYDEEALKKLDWFVRDWRKQEQIHMDPRLFDLVWEVSREVAGDKTIDVVCGYRSPSTNAMLRRRSNGVAQFSQHTLGKAMDFYIPGASLAELRIAGLRMQRGGVGYYPTSGSPFVHMDVGNVRHWPRMSHDELARVFPNGRTVHIPSDGRPLSGYALALADIEKRGSNPSQTSLMAAHNAGVDTSSTHDSRTHQKGLLATLFGKNANQDEDDDNEPDPSATGTTPTARTAAPRRGVFTVASADTMPAPIHLTAATAPPVPPARPEVIRPPAAIPNPTPAEAAVLPMGQQPGDADTAGGAAQWPVRAADNDHVPLDIVLSYAVPSRSGRDLNPTPRAEPMGEASAREIAATPVMATAAVTTAAPVRIVAPAKAVALRDNITSIAKKTFIRPAAAEPVQRVKAPVVIVANPGTRYDDPWLRAIIVTPSITGSMTATLYGEPDFTELRALMNKPTTAVAMSFNDDPYPGITTDRFSGEAVVFLTTYAFPQRTAWLQ